MGVCLLLQLQDAADTLFLPVRTSRLSLLAEWLEDLICGFLLLGAASFTAARGSLLTGGGSTSLAQILLVGAYS
ncbi:hypothetical protein CDO26_04465 [Sinorhizobium meliloti]|nr:hypothetical protein CDO26_04465 [Sinorhizobium meliloti]